MLKEIEELYRQWRAEQPEYEVEPLPQHVARFVDWFVIQKGASNVAV